MGQAELLIAGLLVAVAGLSVLARRLSVPYPIVLVVGGALFGFVPGLPEVKLDPQVVLVVFLPPLVYGASIFANFNDFRANLRALTLSTVGLVLATMCAVAWAAHALVPGLPWEAAFVLGAIVSPTDPLAAAAIMRRLDAPRRMVSSIEGEGLFNDVTALVAYRVAVAAVVAGSFSLADAGLKFVSSPPRRTSAAPGPSGRWRPTPSEWCWTCAPPETGRHPYVLPDNGHVLSSRGRPRAAAAPGGGRCAPAGR